MNNPYDAFSEDYDRFVNWPGRLAFELPFIEARLQEVGARRVLDAATGTGQHVIALAQRGVQADGADLSQGMVEVARRNAAQAGVKASFYVAGFGELEGVLRLRSERLDGEGSRSEVEGSHSDVKGSLSDVKGSLSAVEGSRSEVEGSRSDVKGSLSDVEGSLSAVEGSLSAVEGSLIAAVLRPGGLLLVQNRNFDAVLAEQGRWMDPQSAQEGEREWLFVRFYDFRADGLIDFNILTLARQGSGNWTQRRSQTQLYPLRQAELEAALVAAGFSQVTSYGGLNGAPFEALRSPNLVVSAVKPGR